MSEHIATIEWTRAADAPFVDRKYSRVHTWTFDGGAVVHGSSSPGSVRPPLSDPSAVDPEEGFVASISSCHMLWFLAIAAKAGFVVDSYRDEATGTLGRDGAGKISITTVTLRPAVKFDGTRKPSEEEFATMHHSAHEECFIANSVKSETLCEPLMVE